MRARIRRWLGADRRVLTQLLENRVDLFSRIEMLERNQDKILTTLDQMDEFHAEIEAHPALSIPPLARSPETAATEPRTASTTTPTCEPIESGSDCPT